MASLAPFFDKLKPVLDEFLRHSNAQNLERLETELYKFNPLDMKIVHIHILLPLVLKLEDLEGRDMELRTGLLNCIRFVVSNVYLNDVKGLCSILTIVMKQLRNFEKASTLPNLSEEIKLAGVLCISEAIQHSTTDVLESCYTKQYSTLFGQILLMLVEFIELEQYKKLKLASIDCLMVVFYVHEKADVTDIVLRTQVADTLFAFLPKIISVVFKTSISDEKLGEAIKSASIKALGRILLIMYEETNTPSIEMNYAIKEFKKLIESFKKHENTSENYILDSSKLRRDQMEEHLIRLQNKGRSSQWFKETSLRLRGIFKQTSILRSHSSSKIRYEYAKMCCALLQNCTHNLKECYLLLLESVIALSEDETTDIRQLCMTALAQLQQRSSGIKIFDESADLLLEQHATKFVHILHRQNEYELYAELLFLKGFVRNISSEKLFSMLSLTTFMENFCMALITAVDLKVTRGLLKEEYALRVTCEVDYHESAKLHWRQFQFLTSKRCVSAMQAICARLGATEQVNDLLLDYLLELFQVQQQRLCETLLIMVWMCTSTRISEDVGSKQGLKLAKPVLEQILQDTHWHLALQADMETNLRVDKPSNWYVDRTPGLYESGIEVRMQDYDSDDEQMADDAQQDHVTICDAQANILHTCMILDALGHCATYLGANFKTYVFRSLHKVLLKVASSNRMIYEAAVFALVSIQNALGFENIAKFIEAHIDYISYHLNTILKRSPESSAAVDILSVVLQLSTRNTLPHLENIFQTIRDECSKTQQEQNVSAYLRVYHAFLNNIERWQINCFDALHTATLSTEKSVESKDEVLINWLSILEKPTDFLETEIPMTQHENSTDQNDVGADNNGSTQETNQLPRHIEMIKQILEQTLKFISSSSQAHQIQSLECLIAGVPLLQDYENELLPLVHTIWQPLIEKFRQNDPIVLNRCFTLLQILSRYAKEFILKRVLDDVVPYLKKFLKDAAVQSAAEQTKTQTQVHKLQLKLLQDFGTLIKSTQIDGRHLNDIAEIIVLYLSMKQPKELQTSATNFFVDMHNYNGPLTYVILMKKSHIQNYKENVLKLMHAFHLR